MPAAGPACRYEYWARGYGTRFVNNRKSRACGTEAGAQSHWLPGGYLLNGQIEAVVGLGAAKPGDILRHRW